MSDKLMRILILVFLALGILFPGARAAETNSITITVTTVENQPPRLNAIGNKTINEGQLLEFSISADDPDNSGSELAYSAANLPRGAYFDAANKLFSWLPNYDQQGEYAIHFEVSDGELVDSEDITITVNNVALNSGSGESIGAKIKVRVLP